MAIEIERKFLVQNDDWRSLGVGIAYRQGYISIDKNNTVRVRVVGDQGFLTLKGITTGYSRQEFEYAIPVADALEMLAHLCHGPLIEKTRYRVVLDDLIWEIDEFAGENQGLIVAEVELSELDQEIALPSWIGAEVSDDPRYYNANLIQHPFTRW